MNNISFHNKDVSIRLHQINLTRKWLCELAYEHSKDIGLITYIFCSDNYLLEINRTYLDHNYYTDIITFPYKEDPLESDIFISIDRIRDNAKNFRVTIDNELRRVMAHGLLHLCGFSDTTEIQKVKMKEQEDLALELWDQLLNEKKGK